MQLLIETTINFSQETDPHDNETRKTELCFVQIICICPTVVNKSQAPYRHIKIHLEQSARSSQAQQVWVSMSHDVPGLGNMVLNLWSETEARSLTLGQCCEFRPCSPSPKPLVQWEGEAPLSGRWFSQGETHHLQYGCADPCDFHRCKANEYSCNLLIGDSFQTMAKAFYL